MLCDPGSIAEIVCDALPLASTALPTVLPSTVNVTEPWTVPKGEVTVAVRVIGAPNCVVAESCERKLAVSARVAMVTSLPSPPRYEKQNRDEPLATIAPSGRPSKVPFTGSVPSLLMIVKVCPSAGEPLTRRPTPPATVTDPVASIRLLPAESTKTARLPPCITNDFVCRTPDGPAETKPAGAATMV